MGLARQVFVDTLVFVSTTKAGMALMRYCVEIDVHFPVFGIGLPVCELMHCVIDAVARIGPAAAWPFAEPMMALGSPPVHPWLFLPLRKPYSKSYRSSDRRVAGQIAFQNAVLAESHLRSRFRQDSLEVNAVRDPVDPHIDRVGGQHALLDATTCLRAKTRILLIA